MVEIKITGNTPLEALASVTAFGLHCFSDPDVSAAANRILEAEQAKEHKEAAKVSKSNTDTPAADTAPTGAATAAAELSDAAGKTAAPTNPSPVTDLPEEPYVEDPPHRDPAPEPEPEPQPERQPKPPKLEEVRAKGLEAAKKHGQPAVKAILESFKVPSMTALAESDRAAFLAALEALERQGDGNA